MIAANQAADSVGSQLSSGIAGMLDGNVIADSLGLTELIAGLIGASIDASSGLTFGQTVYGLITAFFPIVVSVCSVVLLIMLMYGPDNASASAGNLRKSGK